MVETQVNKKLKMLTLNKHTTLYIERTHGFYLLNKHLVIRTPPSLADDFV